MYDGDVEFPLSRTIRADENAMARKMTPLQQFILRAIMLTNLAGQSRRPRTNQAFLAFFTALVLSTTRAAGPFFRIDLIALFAAAFDE
jgi:hypothetical protein